MSMLSRRTVLTALIKHDDSLGVLEQAIYAAATWKPMTAEERTALLARTAPLGREGRFEHFKTTGRFDGTAQNPKWLEKAEI